MDDCLLPAIREVMSPNESQAWDFAYVVSAAKSSATGLEGNQYGHRKEGFRQQMKFDLDGDHVAAVWNKCNRRLCRAIQGNGRLRLFKGFQFFINAKGLKYRTHTKGFRELMAVYKDKVSQLLMALNVDRKQL